MIIEHIKNCSLSDGLLIFDSQNIVRISVGGKVVFEYDLIEERENTYKVIKNDNTIISIYTISNTSTKK